MARGTSCSATRYVRDLLSRSIVLCILSCTHAQSTTADALDGLADWLQWDVQPTIKRINESLQKRGYLTWFDLEHMKGSTADCMAGAVDGAPSTLRATESERAAGALTTVNTKIENKTHALHIFRRFADPTRL